MKKYTKNDFFQHYTEHTRIVDLMDGVDLYRINRTLNSIDYLARLSKKPVILRICSPGGSVDAGIVLYDYIKASKVPIHTYCVGMAASMGAILLGAGHKRFITKNSRVMIHQPSSGYIGKVSDIEIHANESKRIKDLLNQILSNDTGQKLNKVKKDTEVDKWMTAQEAVDYGLVDKII